MFRMLSFKTAILGAVALAWAGAASINPAAAEYCPDSNWQQQSSLSPAAYDLIGYSSQYRPQYSYTYRNCHYVERYVYDSYGRHLERTKVCN